MQRVIVTGGAGFVGSHLVDHLLRENGVNEVVVIDRLSTGAEENLPKDQRVTVHKASITDDIGALFKGIDVVFHLAALTRPQWSILHPEESNAVNVGGTLKVLLHCRDHGVKRLVFASSASTYGEQEVLPIPETARPKPMCPYGLQKVIGEQYCELFERIYGLETNSLRYFNVYGTRMRPFGEYSAVIPRFINLIRSGQQPTVHGDGTNVRDYTHVDDVVAATILAAKSKTHGEVFNVGSGTSISVNSLTGILLRMMGSKVEPLHVPAVLEPRATLADISKAKKLLGWVPRIGLEEGLGRLLDSGTIPSNLTALN